MIPQVNENDREGLSMEVTELAKRIVKAVKPQQVVLFGSYARGDTHRWSDVDLLVVVPDGCDEEVVRRAANAAVQDSSLSCDVVVATEGRVRRLGNVVGTVFRPALRDGRLLYDAQARPKWDRAGRPARLEVDPVTEDQRLAQARLWVRQARTDLRTAELALATPDLDPDPACYHAQQAAEKALKAVLVFLQIDYPFTHDLDDIRRRLPDDWRVKEEYRDLQALSNWVFKARYPGDWPPPTAEDAQQATTWARSIYEAVLRDLHERGYTEG